MAKFSYLRAPVLRLAAVATMLLASAPAFAHITITLGGEYLRATDLGKVTEWDSSGKVVEAEIPDVDGWGYNYFRFEVEVAGPVRVWTSGGFSPYIVIFDGSGMTMTSASTSARYVVLDNAGAHYIRTSSRSSDVYRLHVTGGGKGHDDIGNLGPAEPGPVAAPITACAGPRPASNNPGCKMDPSNAEPWDGETTLATTARLDYERDRDWFTFDVPDGPPISVRMWSSGGTDTYAFLYDENDFRLETDDDDGAGYNFSIHRTLDPGTYYLGVYGGSHSTTGPYRLHLAGRDDHGNSWGTESRAQLPTDLGGIQAMIDYGNDWDGFWFQVSTPGNVQIWTTGNIDTYGVLYDAFEVELTRNDDSGAGYNFSIRRTLDPGVYYIWVTDSGHSTGPYSLHLSGDASGVLTVPLVPADDNVRGQQGFVRIINRSDQRAEVWITAVDDTGMRRELSSPLQLAAWQTLHFNSQDLERGNANKGMASGIGSGMGNWYLEVAPTRPEVEVLSYIRTEDGFLTSMHTQPPIYGRTHRVVTFNPGSNMNQASRLRLINLRCPQADISGCEAANVTIYGVDDAGKRSPDVRLAVPPGAVREVTAAELEGLAQNAEGLEGSLGDGAGKWQLFVSSDLPIQVISLLESVSGHLTNLSAPAAGR